MTLVSIRTKKSTYAKHMENIRKGNYQCVACRTKRHGNCTKTRWGKQSVCTCPCKYDSKLHKRIIPTENGSVKIQGH